MPDRVIPGRRRLPKRLHTGLRISGIVILALALVLAALLAFLSPLSQRWVVGALSSHYHATVQLKSFNISLFPRLSVSGAGLVLKYKDQPGAPPLASIGRFSMDTTWIGLLRHPAHVRHIWLEGLVINVPPRHVQQQEQRKTKKRRLPPFYFETISADQTVLNVFSRNPQKPPRAFAISNLQLRSVAVGKAMSFKATLTNPKPIGQIHTTGDFGPWQPSDPSLTPVSGSYEFNDADLSTIHGLAGILSSQGTFSGILGLISVHGQTDTPNFGIGIGSNRIDLKTWFDAVVNGSNGNTLLRPVKAQLGESMIRVRGGVLRTTGIKGRTIQLTASADHARLRDLLLLAVKSPTPPMLGRASLKTQLDLPPGKGDIARRLKLHGNFRIHSAHFTDPKVEEKITHLSRRGQGKPEQQGGSMALMNFTGQFDLANSIVTFPRLSFDVPGASVHLHGTYGLLNENLDFRGTLQLEAKLSQTTTGIKSLLLKVVDPLFKGKNGGALVPIKVNGTREHASFGIQFGKVLRRIP